MTLGLTKATLQCTVKPLFFFFHTKSQPFNKKPKQNYIKQSQQTIQNLSINNTPKTTTTNNPHNLSIKNTPKTNHNKQTRKTISPIKRKINHKTTTANNPSKQTRQTISPIVKSITQTITTYNHNKQPRHTINRNKQSYLSITKSVRKYNNNKQSFNQVLPKTTILSISRENNHDNQ